MHHVLPTNLGRLATHAGECTRFATTGVRVTFDREEYTADATDTKCAVRVRGTYPIRSENYPTLPALAAAPNGAAGAIVPAADWRKAFGAARKLKFARAKELEGVACVTGDAVTTFAATNASEVATVTAQNVPGRFVPMDEVIAKAEKEYRRGAGTFSISVDAKLLAEVLLTLAEFTDPDTANRVTFQFVSNEKGFLIRTGNGTQNATALVMPLSD